MNECRMARQQERACEAESHTHMLCVGFADGFGMVGKEAPQGHGVLLQKRASHGTAAQVVIFKRQAG
jgi:hypothetical protein